jgi:hypothetical protein
MRFRGSVEFWIEVNNLEQAEQVVSAAERAAYAALGDAAIDEPESNAVSKSFYEPIDDAARAALDKEDLGHGIQGSTFRYSVPAHPMSSTPCDGPTGMTERDPALEQFDALIGTWATQATHPQIDAVASGSVTFEWLEGGHFLVQRSHNDHELFPDTISVIGAPESGVGLVMEYFDSRGVRRTYGVALEDGVLRIWRDDPTFAQRFSATLGQDSFEGQWQLAPTPGDWQDDLKVTYRRSD